MGLLRLSASALSTETGQQSCCHRPMAGLGEVFVTSAGTHGGRLCPDAQYWNVISAWSGMLRSVLRTELRPRGISFCTSHYMAIVFSNSSSQVFCFLCFAARVTRDCHLDCL